MPEEQGTPVNDIAHDDRKLEKKAKDMMVWEL